jgi:hypothetical protein
MAIKFWGSVLLLFVSSMVFAQQDSTHRKTNHYVGVQANQLIKQLFNLSNSSSAAVNNPYLIVYSFNSIQTGWGMNFGLGYTFNEFKDGDAFSRRETKINNYFFRFGVEKKTSLGKKWIFSAGFDVTNDNQKNNTKTNSGGSTFETDTKSKGWGVGPRVTLNYKITDRILLGTECTYYFRAGKNTLKSSSNFGPTEETSDKENQFLFTVPAVLILIVKF